MIWLGPKKVEVGPLTARPVKMYEFVFEMARLRHMMVMWWLQMVELGFVRLKEFGITTK